MWKWGGGGEEGAPRGWGVGRTAPVPVKRRLLRAGRGWTCVTPHGTHDAPWHRDPARQHTQLIGGWVQVCGGGTLALSCGCCGGIFTAEMLHAGDAVLRGGGRDACARCACTCMLQGAGGGGGGWRLERGRCGGVRGAARASTVCLAWVAVLTWEHAVPHAACVPVVRRLSLHGNGARGHGSPAQSCPGGGGGGEMVSMRGEPTRRGGPGSLVRARGSVQGARVHRGLPSPRGGGGGPEPGGDEGIAAAGRRIPPRLR